MKYKFVIHKNMIYSPLTYKAMRICYEAHKDVWDKSGAPYVFHPFTVAEKMDDEISTAVALLHDVVEDTDWTFDDLRNEGIPESVIGPLELVTHRPEIPYMEYVKNLAKDPVARKVKLSDLAHNMDTSRYCRDMTDSEKRKMVLYQSAKEYLLSFQ